MGSIYKFICPKCGSIEYSSLGLDVGFIAVIQPMICEDCKKLVSVLIGRYGKDGPTGDPDYDKNLNCCPECKGQNLHVWPDDDPFTKCGTIMEIGQDEEVILWD